MSLVWRVSCQHDVPKLPSAFSGWLSLSITVSFNYAASILRRIVMIVMLNRSSWALLGDVSTALSKKQHLPGQRQDISRFMHAGSNKASESLLQLPIGLPQRSPFEEKLSKHEPDIRDSIRDQCHNLFRIHTCIVQPLSSSYTAQAICHCDFLTTAKSRRIILKLI